MNFSALWRFNEVASVQLSFIAHAGAPKMLGKRLPWIQSEAYVMKLCNVQLILQNKENNGKTLNLLKCHQI